MDFLSFKNTYYRNGISRNFCVKKCYFQCPREKNDDFIPQSITFSPVQWKYHLFTHKFVKMPHPLKQIVRGFIKGYFSEAKFLSTLLEATKSKLTLIVAAL